MAAPSITFSYTKNALSRVTGYQSLTVTFSADLAYTAFECRATKSGDAFGRGVGKLLASFADTPAQTARSFTVYGTDLLSGDGTYRISLYAQSQDGGWNDNAGFMVSGNQLITADNQVFLSMN